MKNIDKNPGKDWAEVYKTFSAENKKIIQEFLKYCEITAGKNSIKKISSKIIMIAYIINKPLNAYTLEDIREFLALLNHSSKAISTKNDTKKVLKRFLRWKYDNWNKTFNGLKDVRLNSKEGRRITKEDLLTSSELALIVRSVDSLKYKTLLVLLQETAGRPEELLKLKWKDINLEKGEVKLDSAKTGQLRHIPLNESIAHLKRYKMEAFFETPRAEEFVFPGQNKEKHLSVQRFSLFLNELERKIDFPRHLYPYLWRHTILSRAIKKLTPKAYEMFAGHSLKVGMETYAHLDTDDLKEELFKNVYKVESLTPKEKKEYQELKERLEVQGKSINQIERALFRLIEYTAKKETRPISETPMKEVSFIIGEMAKELKNKNPL